MSIGVALINAFSNIIHKVDARIANNAKMVNGMKEANRKRVNNNITANGTAVNVFTAPWNGYVEELNIAGDNSTASVSSSGNSVTVTVTDETTSTTLAVFDTFTNAQEISKTGFKAVFSPGVSEGNPLAEFLAGHVISITVAVTGSPTNFTSSNVCTINAALTPADHNFAY